MRDGQPWGRRDAAQAVLTAFQACFSFSLPDPVTHAMLAVLVDLAADGGLARVDPEVVESATMHLHMRGGQAFVPVLLADRLADPTPLSTAFKRLVPPVLGYNPDAGIPALPSIAALLEDPDPETVSAAIRGLVRVSVAAGPDAIVQWGAVLLPHLTDPAECGDALAVLAPHAASYAVPGLRRALVLFGCVSPAQALVVLPHLGAFPDEASTVLRHHRPHIDARGMAAHGFVRVLEAWAASRRPDTPLPLSADELAHYLLGDSSALRILLVQLSAHLPAPATTQSLAEDRNDAGTHSRTGPSPASRAAAHPTPPASGTVAPALARAAHIGRRRAW